MSSNSTCIPGEDHESRVPADWIETTCLNCESNADTVVLYPRSFSVEALGPETFSARRETEHYHYQLLRCRRCGMVFSSPVLAPARQAELYRRSAVTYSNEAPAIARTYIHYLERHAHLLARREVALEVGCGSGFFLRELSRFGFKEVLGVEPSEDAVQRAGELRGKIYNGFFENASFENGSIDLICCFQTLDHVTNPLNVLKKCAELLRPGGAVYLIVHNERAMQARVFGERSPIYDVEHVYLFNRTTLSRVCEKAGLRPAPVFAVRNTYPLDYWLRMAPIPAKRWWRRCGELLRISQVSLTIPAGNIGIFARKPRS